MLARVIRFLIGVPLVFLLLGFVMLNRQDTSIVYSPMHEPLTAPIMWIGMLFLCVGFLSGVILLWAEYGSVRQKSRAMAKQVKQLEKQLANSMLSKPMTNKEE